MGLLERAKQIREKLIEEKLNNLERYFGGRFVSKEEALWLKQQIDKRYRKVLERLDRKLIEMSTLFDIGKELTSTLNLKELIDVMMFSCMGQVQASKVAVLLRDKKKFVVKAMKGYTDEKVKEMIGKEVEFDDEIQSEMIKNKGLEPSVLSGIENGIFGELESNLVIPLLAKDEKVVGLLSIGSKFTGQGYSDEEKDFLFTLGSLAGVAVENAELYENLKRTNAELDRSLKELSALYEVSKVINSSTDFNEVVNLIIETLTTGFKLKMGFLAIYDDNNILTIVRSFGFPEEEKPDGSPVIELENLVSDEDEAKLIPNFQKDENIKSVFSLYSVKKMHVFIVVPLRASGKKVGFLVINSVKGMKKGDYDKRFLNLFSIIASQIAPPLLMTRMVQEEQERGVDPIKAVVERLNSEMELADSFNSPFSVALIKMTNLGEFMKEREGEIVEKFGEVATALTESARQLTENSAVFRYTVSSFVVVFPGEGKESVDSYRDNLVEAIQTVFSKENFQIEVESSVATYPDDASNPYELLQALEQVR